MAITTRRSWTVRAGAASSAGASGAPFFGAAGLASWEAQGRENPMTGGVQVHDRPVEGAHLHVGHGHGPELS